MKRIRLISGTINTVKTENNYQKYIIHRNKFRFFIMQNSFKNDKT